MSKLEIKGDKKTPEVVFSGAGKLKISGRSIPENSTEFYSPVLNWLDDYSSNPSKETLLTIELEYFNTSSSKCLLDVFRKLEPLHAGKKSDVRVLWKYEEDDEDIMEAGEDYQSIIKLPFEIEQLD